jgi:ParB-like chromosome segregation protein Spo0J
MKPANLQGMSVAALVEKFCALCLSQYEAELRSELSKENRLIRQMFAVREELKARPGDQRHALMPLYRHPNIQVRLMAAKETLAVAPVAAREMLQAIKDSGQMPQSMDAGMCLWALDEGIHKPT